MYLSSSHGLNLFGANKANSAVSAILVSADGKRLFAVNNSDGFVYILETHGGRALARIKAGDHPINAALAKDEKTLLRRQPRRRRSRRH